MNQAAIILKGLLWDGPVLVHVDSRRKDVDVPPHLRDDAQLVLRLGTGLIPSIPDLTIDDVSGVRASLTFSGYLYECHLPWQAIYAMSSEVSDAAVIIKDNVPADVKAENDTQDTTEPPVPPRPKLKLVD